MVVFPSLKNGCGVSFNTLCLDLICSMVKILWLSFDLSPAATSFVDVVRWYPIKNVFVLCPDSPCASRVRRPTWLICLLQVSAATKTKVGIFRRCQLGHHGTATYHQFCFAPLCLSPELIAYFGSGKCLPYSGFMKASSEFKQALRNSSSYIEFSTVTTAFIAMPYVHDRFLVWSLKTELYWLLSLL